VTGVQTCALPIFDWHLEYPDEHGGIGRYISALNRLYAAVPALHERDVDPQGFEWIDASDAASSVIAFLRKGRDPDHPVLVVCNFTPAVRYDYQVGVPFGGPWRELLNSDAAEFAGSGVGNLGQVRAESVPWHGRPYSVKVSLPPLSVIYFGR
jgi:1,4-alpha-glucan branching enzyme